MLDQSGLIETNPVLEKLPKHLMSLVIDQPYNEYTAQDHAVWRFVMRQNVRYLSKVAHGSYLEGLKRTGISIDSIPHMYGMNRILKDIGWAAVSVDGFIPPSAFMEFQAYNVLVIAADIRPIDQIEYTPAPDIIHEAAGHAPIIADPEYAEYLTLFGEIGSKAISSARDYDLYEAVRHLSILKADPYTPPADIKTAEQQLAHIESTMGEPSEMALIRNLHWWTVEYGLIGTLEQPKIYGAGLLSSIGESYSCLKPAVKKLPYTVAAANYSFDITTRQPHLFVTPDFQTLKDVLNEFADQMALRKGGIYGLNKALESKNTATAVYSSGIQVSGTFSEVIESEGKPVYIRTSSPTALAVDNRQLAGHGKDYHATGFGSPVGRLVDSDKPFEMYSYSELDGLGIKEGNEVKLEFESGVKLRGRIKSILRQNGRIVVISFTDCLVKLAERTLFEPAWGVYDMAVGEDIESVFSGPADANAFELNFEAPKEKSHKIVHDQKARELHGIYARIRTIRETQQGFDEIPTIWEKLQKNYPEDWLAVLELLELLKIENTKPELQKTLQAVLISKKQQPELADLIGNGLELLAG